MTDLFSNPRFEKFRKLFEARGYNLRLLWSASTGRNPSGKGFDDIGCFSVIYGDPPPAHRTMIIQDYGEHDGFGVWLDSRTSSLSDGVDEVLGTPKARETP